MDFDSVTSGFRAGAVASVAATLVAIALVGCEPQAKSQQPAASAPIKPQQQPTKSATPPAPARPDQSKAPPSVPQPKQRANPTLTDLVATARATEFDLPRLDEGKIAAAGIRRLEGQHLVLYT